MGKKWKSKGGDSGEEWKRVGNAKRKKRKRELRKGRQ